MKRSVLVDYVRTPFDYAEKGALRKVRPDDLGVALIKALVKRNALKTDEIEDVICGCAFPEAEQGLNVARMMALQAGLPQSVAGQTINRFCGSSMQAIHQAVGAIALGAGDLFICLGIESMSRVPILGYNPLPNPALMKACPQAYMSMGETAENLARSHDISRDAQEEFALRSQQKAHKAEQDGYFKDEIIPIEALSKDGCIRPDATKDSLQSLKPAFDQKGTITAATASPLTDGASAVLVCSEDYARQNGLTPLAAVKSIAISGCAPETMGLGPVYASQKALQRAALDLDDMALIELNEAFGAQALACLKDMNLAEDRLNLDGGALALGHPLGATGARITGKLASLMAREKAPFGLATQCIGGGQGIATVLEAL